jgi:cellulose synthase/poly-beta-1,6-N-acetylglucosamine synthase-like glycosyltransferase
MKKIIVTAMVVVRNEQDYIEQSLMSLINQDFPKENYEIIVVDGLSNDNTLKIINDIIKNNNTKVKITLLKNEKRILAAGWNIGIKNAKGEYVVRIDAHAKANKDFIKQSLDTMKKMPKDVACVGGKITSVSLKGGDETVSKVLSSPFGIGNSKFRYSDKAQYVDTVAFGLYKRSIFDEVGLFDETLERNQDNNMHNRIRKAGYKFYFNPRIKSEYYVRNSLKKMLRQGFLNGKWNVIVFRQDKKSLSIRHIVPLFFVLSIIVLTGLSFVSKYFLFVLLLELLLYIVLAILFALKKTKNIIEVFKMLVYYFLLHVSYGIGEISSIFRII